MAPLAGEAYARHKRRAQAAWGVRDQWQKALFDAYNFVAPYRLSTRWVTKSPQNRADLIFDNTAVMAHVRSVGRLQQDLFPTGEPFFTLELGPMAEHMADGNGDQIEQMKAELEVISTIANAVFNTGEWDGACSEMISDLLISTGFLMALKGTPKHPVRFVSASMDEMAIDEGPYGCVHGIFWKRKWSIRAIVEGWPKGQFTDTFRDSATTKGEEEVVLCQDVVWDDESERWRLYVYLEQDEAPMIHSEESRECPWITPRYFRMPGQVYGFGPVLMVLPTVKSLNKAMEITLKAAALSMLGIFTRVDDGVFNPDTARIEPGAIWTVARNGGPMGPSIARLQPGEINVSNIVLQDLRQQVQTVMEDVQLPPTDNSPRSAVEIAERIKRAAADQTGDEVLLAEIGVPLVNRVLEILHDLRVIPEAVEIDGMSVKMELASPAALAQKASPVSALATWLQMIQAVSPQMIHVMTPLDQTLAEIGEDIGVPQHLINDTAKRADVMKAAAQVVTPMVQNQINPPGAQPEAPPPNGAPAQAGLRVVK